MQHYLGLKTVKVLILLSLGKVAAIKAIAANLAIAQGPVNEANAIAGTGFCKDIAHVVINCAFTN